MDSSLFAEDRSGEKGLFPTQNSLVVEENTGYLQNITQMFIAVTQLEANNMKRSNRAKRCSD